MTKRLALIVVAVLCAAILAAPVLAKRVAGLLSCRGGNRQVQDERDGTGEGRGQKRFVGNDQEGNPV